MFDIGWSEIVVIGVVALIVIGPKELPAVLRAIGQWTTKIRRMAGEFQSQFQEAMREAEMADLKKQVDDLGDAAKGVALRFRSARLSTRRPDGSPSRTSAGRGSKTDPRANPPRVGRPKPRRRPRRLKHTSAAVPVAEPAGAGAPEPSTAHSPAARPRRTSDRLPSRILRRWPKGAAGHDARGHRGDQGAADGASDRAARAAHQGAGGVRADVHRLFLLRQADIQHPDVALRLGGGTGEFEVHLYGAPRIFRRAAQDRDVRWRVPVLSDHCGSALPVRRARSLSQRAASVPSLPHCDSVLLPARLARRLCCLADAGALLDRHAAGGQRQPGGDRVFFPRSTTTSG